MSQASYDFSGQRVLVTGAARGIGRVIAAQFRAAGADVVAIDLKFDAPTAGLTQITCDLTDGARARHVVAQDITDNGAFTVLVNNAGSDRRIPFADMTDADWQFMLDVNLSHYPVLSQTVAPGMAAAGGGAIINLSSSAWMKMAGNLAAYHTAKAGIIGLTRGMARDLGPDLIRVNAIAPGRVVTERTTQSSDPAWVSETKTLQAIPELLQADDIAQTALWLGSRAAKMITGQTLVVDGGVV